MSRILGCASVTYLLLAAAGCSSPGCIRNSDCPVDWSCLASTCQLPAAGSSAAAGSSGKAGAAGVAGVAAGSGGSAGPIVIVDAGIVDAGIVSDAQAP